MLDTLLKIGEWKSRNASEWDRFLDKPKVHNIDKKGNPIRNYKLSIIFDLDTKNVLIDKSNLKEFDEENDIRKMIILKILPGNNKNFYYAAPFKKLNLISKTFFGKDDLESEKGDLMKILDKDFPHFINSDLYNILNDSYNLKEKFLSLVINPETNLIEDNYSIKQLELSGNENVVFTYVSIKSEKYGFPNPIPFIEIEEYKRILEEKFLKKNKSSTDLKDENKLCYASGKIENEVNQLDLKSRYSLNKMFVTETRNFASQFQKDNFNLNYQVSSKNQECLDFASSYILNGYKIKIAGIEHVIVPQFLSNQNLDFDLILDDIKNKSDLLFVLNNTIERLVTNIEDESETVYWINYISFESDGNFFKSTGIIKDVSKLHLVNVINSFTKIDWEFRNENTFVNWDSVMTDYGKGCYFNFNSVYSLIPVRKDKEKRSKALEFFKSILENRKVNTETLFKYFKELILCHYYKRYISYNNVKDYSQNGKKNKNEYFFWAVRDSVFKYIAFIKVLRNLNLLIMEEDRKETVSPEKEKNKYDEAIQDFFKRMAFTVDQKAMFYLGRMLNTVSYIQKDKNKTVIDKVNYNGMDKDDIVRLRISLFEKAKQYNESKKIIFSDSKFADHFDFTSWKMDPNEALFFILTGYSFGINIKDNSLE